MVICVRNGSLVLIPGPLVEGRKYIEDQESSGDLIPSWRSYYSRFPDNFDKLTGSWYAWHYESIDQVRDMRMEDIRVASISASNPWYKRYGLPFVLATECEISLYRRQRSSLPEEDSRAESDSSKTNFLAKGSPSSPYTLPNTVI